MRTEDLIEALAADVPPVPSSHLRRRLRNALAAGALFASVPLIVMLGVRPDLMVAMVDTVFWAKLAYPAAAMLIGLGATVQLARPDCQRVTGIGLLALPIACLFAMAAAEMLTMPQTARLPALSWTIYPAVTLLAVPILTILLVALRTMAPTRRALAGAAAGLAAGGAAAAVYCLHCQQESWTLILVSYTSAIGLIAGLGGIAGARLLRW